jgi:O-acetyl-ADP-ribose deacetylase (regulator of RNase III)
MRDVCEQQGITHLAMPRIGCGLDRLKWEKVSVIIQDTFADMDIEIVVCTI